MKLGSAVDIAARVGLGRSPGPELVGRSTTRPVPLPRSPFVGSGLPVASLSGLPGATASAAPGCPPALVLDPINHHAPARNRHNRHEAVRLPVRGTEPNRVAPGRDDPSAAGAGC